MKKNIFLTTLSILLISSIGYSQSPLPVGRTQVNLGVGLSGWGIPVYLGFDVSVHKDITLGAEFSYREYRENWKDHYYRHNIMGFSGNANYHFNSLLGIPQKWDFYAGLNIGFYVWNSDKDYYGNHSSGLGIGGQIGGRYYFSNKFGINLEFGGGNAFSGGKFGLTIKL
jgi:hypothetical protein